MTSPTANGPTLATGADLRVDLPDPLPDWVIDAAEDAGIYAILGRKLPDEVGHGVFWPHKGKKFILIDPDLCATKGEDPVQVVLHEIGHAYIRLRGIVGEILADTYALAMMDRFGYRTWNRPAELERRCWSDWTDEDSAWMQARGGGIGIEHIRPVG